MDIEMPEIDYKETLRENVRHYLRLPNPNPLISKPLSTNQSATDEL